MVVLIKNCYAYDASQLFSFMTQLEGEKDIFQNDQKPLSSAVMYLRPIHRDEGIQERKHA